MKVHLIAIGGSAMHNVALALHDKGFEVTGSDDQIFEPSKSRLKAKGLLPQKEGWDSAHIHKDLDAVILGMHAKKDNPELLKAQELGIPIYSYPEYVYEQSKHKKRVVIGGSHGKTSITSMVLHVLIKAGKNPDYLVGAQLEGFENMVKLTQEADCIILEGDEYLSSPLDLTPKFHWYKPHVAVLSGIAWDHVNVFPTFENYLKQFEIFRDTLQKEGLLFYFEGDAHLQNICEGHKACMPYQAHPSEIVEGKTYLITDNQKYPVQIFGAHNLQNLSAALEICKALNLSTKDFYTHIQSFKGAAKRLERIAGNNNGICFKDFAHSPSKLKATTTAVKNQYPQKKLVACMELHTFSSLTPSFLKEYKGSMDAADVAIVFYSPKAVAHKKLPALSPEDVLNAFDREDLKVYTDSSGLSRDLKAKKWEDSNLLIMTSGNFEGLDIDALGKELFKS